MSDLDDYGMPIERQATPPPFPPRVLARPDGEGRPTHRLAKAIQDATDGDPDKLQRLIDEVVEAASKVIERGSPLTRKLVTHTKNAYEFSVEILSNNKVEDPWTYAAVKEYGGKFIELRARISKGHGGGMVKASTVGGWYSCFVICISKYAHDPETGFKVGGRLLYREGYAAQLLDRVKNVIDTLKLDRHSSRNKTSCGLPEARLLIEWMLASSVFRGRIVKLQLTSVVIIALYTGLRPSSFCAGHKEDVALEKYMKMGDLKIWNRGDLRFDIELDVYNFKGHNASVIGNSVKYWLRGLSKAHNQLFDTSWIVVYAWIRGCLGHYPTLTDLLNTTDDELVITSPKAPFLLKPNMGGTHLTDEPWNSNGLSAAVVSSASKSGLENVSMGSFRRGAAKDLSSKCGNADAGLVLAHKDSHTVSTTFYSDAVANINLTGIRTGEATEHYRPGAEAS
ncbi:hypothetical protein BN14_11490 [Rhizoctonia solani AG-1 IB]|uniref:Uncharacterized protein n=1 Tax=Thanatephorus cucumeris (strain AG1-IB / isolate 7/3/14) TaxID=1108050 RepID=M5CDU8_THACB|nr:hypothetical protein BN14_11490 [Rhizoctonia solani AG-1 IB]